jgi:hypothetical protein
VDEARDTKEGRKEGIIAGKEEKQREKGTHCFRRHSFDQRLPSRDRQRVGDLTSGKTVK